MTPETPSPSVTNRVIQFCKAEMVDHSASPPPEYDEAQGEAWIGGYAAAIEIVHDFAALAKPVSDVGSEQRARELLAAEYDRAGYPLIGKAVRRGSKALSSEIVCRAIQAALPPHSDIEGLREALRPFLAEIDRLEEEYGFDRPPHQLQPLMVPLVYCQRLQRRSRTVLGGL